VASGPALAVRPDASSLPTSEVPAAGAVVAVQRVASKEACAGAETARSAEEFATAEQARADHSAALGANGSFYADLVPDDSIRVRYSAGQWVDGSIQADLVLGGLGSGRLYG